MIVWGNDVLKCRILFGWSYVRSATAVKHGLTLLTHCLVFQMRLSYSVGLSFALAETLVVTGHCM